MRHLGLPSLLLAVFITHHHRYTHRAAGCVCVCVCGHICVCPSQAEPDKWAISVPWVRGMPVTEPVFSIAVDLRKVVEGMSHTALSLVPFAFTWLVICCFLSLYNQYK